MRRPARRRSTARRRARAHHRRRPAHQSGASSRRSAVRTSFAPGPSTPASSTAILATLGGGARRSRRGGVRRGGTAGAGGRADRANASIARPMRRLRPGMRPTVFSSPASARPRCRFWSTASRSTADVNIRRERLRRLLWMACRPPDATAIEAADAVYVLRQGRQTVVRRADLGSGDLDHADGDGQIKAPMHGKVLALLVGRGDAGGEGAAVGHYRGDEDGARPDRAARGPRRGHRGCGRQPGRGRREADDDRGHG